MRTFRPIQPMTIKAPLRFVAVLVGLSLALPAQEPPAVEPYFELPAPAMDLRSMLRRHVLRRSAEELERAAARRTEAIRRGAVPALRDRLRAALRQTLGDLPFGARGGPLNPRVASRHDRPGYRLENVLFESLPGWDVNATLYLPRHEDFPPPWPAIVVPVGHSGKQFKDYQQPAQVFARAGYVALTFDPPGQAGEKRPGNDHFRDGVRGYLTGESSQRYFVLDALRAIDYLATRPDVDLSRGAGMTGVSGGGFTTLYAAALDDRIRAAGPSCFAAPELDHPLRDGYAPCPETLAFGLYPRGLDAASLLIAAHPTPLLMMAGRDDEVFKAEWMQAMARETSRAYAAASSGDRFRFFLDAAGHAYTVAQALEFVRWMDRWVRGTPDRRLPRIEAADLEMAPYEVLRCFPRPEENMLTLARRQAAWLREHRSGLSVPEAARKAAGVDPARLPSLAPRQVKAAPPFRIWTHQLQELLLEVEPDIQLPATLLYGAAPGARAGAILYFDDRGRWTELAAQGMLASMIRFTRSDEHPPGLLTVDLRGWGDTRPAPAPYEVAGWASPQRWLAYTSAALGDPVFAMRIRDGLAALAWLRARPQVDPQRVVAGGRGLGGVVALHVAAIDRTLRGVFAAEIPATFELLAGSAEYAWDHDAFSPGVLPHYDLPELLADLPMPALLVNPLDAKKQPLAPAAANQTYGTALATRRVELHAALAPADSRKMQEAWVDGRWR